MEPLGIISNLRDLWRNSGLESNSPFSDCFALVPVEESWLRLFMA